MFAWGFIIGALIGGTIGAMAMALATAASEERWHVRDPASEAFGESRP